MIRHEYRVRRQTSGRSAFAKYIVVRVVDGKARRVSVHPHATREGAQAAADQLNVDAMVRDYDEDPRPYEIRRAEAETAYRAQS